MLYLLKANGKPSLAMHDSSTFHDPDVFDSNCNSAQLLEVITPHGSAVPAVLTEGISEP
jgi:hypothetical protein